ncbi:MAG: EamA family transporter [Prevotellamassilia sp.]
MLYHFIAFLTVAIWGTTFVSTKVLLTHGLTPAFIFLLRFSLAYVGMAAMQMAHDHGKPTWHCHSWRDEGLMLLAGMTGGSFYFLTENTALQLALAGNVSLIVCLAPLITALFACFIPGNKRAGRRLWTGSLIAFTGLPSWLTAVWGQERRATLLEQRVGLAIGLFPGLFTNW